MPKPLRYHIFGWGRYISKCTARHRYCVKGRVETDFTCTNQ